MPIICRKSAVFRVTPTVRQDILAKKQNMLFLQWARRPLLPLETNLSAFLHSRCCGKVVLELVIVRRGVLVGMIPGTFYGAPSRTTQRTDHRFSLDGLDLPGRADRYIPDLYDLAHVSPWEPYNLHDLGKVFWIGSVPYRSCTTSHNGWLGCKRSINRS